MSGNPAEVKLVSNAMANITRRKIMKMLVGGSRTVDEIKAEVGPAMLDYHLNILVQAGLAQVKDGTVVLTDFGTNFMQGTVEKTETKSSLEGTKPIEVAEVRQLLPCIADKSKFRLIARIDPPLGGALKLLEPLFPRGRYSEKIGSLIIQKGNVLITIYGSGNLTMTMISGEAQAKQILEDLKRMVNEAIAKGVTPAPRERVRIDPMEVNKYLPGTNCRECGEQSCYTFAIRLTGGEVELGLCKPLQEPKYSTSLEHLRALMAYL